MAREMSMEDAERQFAMKKAQEEQIEALLAALLTKEARSRLSNIQMVRPEKAQGVQRLILSAAQSGQISAAKPLDEKAIISLLEQISAQEKKSSTIQTRHKVAIDSSEDSGDY
jgi:DNA-binding TFAR19-related protein (PDSD5 family)